RASRRSRRRGSAPRPRAGRGADRCRRGGTPGRAALRGSETPDRPRRLCTTRGEAKMHAMRALLLAVLARCATATAPPPAAPAPPHRPAGPSGPPPPPADATPEERAFADDYEAAVARAEKDDLAGAFDLLARRGGELEAANRFDLAGICWNTTTWVKW